MIPKFPFRILLLICCLVASRFVVAQATYGAAGSYGLRLINPTYKGNAIKVRRTCDNATLDIGFTCGALNTAALTAFVAASNPLSAMSGSADAAYSLRKLKCTYVGNAINVRRSCDNANKDIGFTANGDLDTNTLKTFVIASNPLGDISTAAAAAYGLRQLSCTYVGKAINVRRSSDNTTSDIGFTVTGDLDTTALKTFVGAGSGFVTIWYDQSGNGKNATQVTAGNQPRIVNAGVIDRQNTLPAMRYISGSNMYLLIPQASVFILSASYVVGSADAANAASNWWGAYRTGGNTGGANRSLANGESPALSGFSIWSDWGGFAVNTVNVNQTGTRNLTSATLSQVTTTEPAPVAIATYSSTGITFGGDAQNTYAALTGYLSELVFFSSALSATDNQFMQWSQAQYYNISGITVGAMPASITSGYIATWYDQSGNGYNLTQGTAADQPRIINAGVIDRANGTVAAFFNGTSDFMSNASYNMLLNSQTATWNAVIYPIGTNNAYSPIVSWRDGAGSICSQLEVGPANNWNICWWSTQSDYPTVNGHTVTNNTYQILTSLVQATASQMYYNGVLSYNNSGQTNTPSTAGNPAGNNTTSLVVGEDMCCAGRFISGYLNEIVLLATNMTTADRQFLEWSQGQYYNVAIAAPSPMPVTAASAYVSTWYDQSGNGNNLTQASIANQPLIVNAGVIELQGVLPTIHFDGASQYLTASAFTTAFNNTVGGTLNALGANTGSAAWQGLAQQGRNTGTWWGLWGSNTAMWTGGFSNGPTNMISGTAASVFEPITLIQHPSSSSKLYGGGSQIVTSASTANSSNATAFYTGYAANASEYWQGVISEVNVLASDINATQQAIMESNQAAYYGLTVSNSVYTPANGYNLFVNGIGVTTAFSDSVQATRQSVGMGFIDNGFLQNSGDMITSGTTCPTAAVTTALYMPIGAGAGSERWLNDWLINKTDVGGNGGNLKIYFDFSDYGVSAFGAPGVASNYQLWGRANPTSNFTVIATTSVTVSGNRVIFTLPSVNITTTWYYTIGTTDNFNSPLPIELLTFTATPLDNKVNIAWATSSETNNNYFTVERSGDGTDFAELTRVPSKASNGTSTTPLSYLVTDPSPLNGTSYYRLKQTDNNGLYNRFNVVSVNFVSEKNILFSVFPNPNTGSFTINFSGIENNQEVQIVIHDAMGRMVYSQQFYSASINDNKIHIAPSNGLAKGIYECSLTAGGIRRKLVVIVN